ncbi:MAG: hypothetical protein OEW09_05720, partial [Anaerolineae bacterium]|nr:hypothetical protein [Anaerolineae bacterium]
MNKRVFLSLLVVLLVLSVAACGPTATPVPAATEKPAATEAPKPTEPPSQAVEITFMAWGAPEELAVWQQIADEFQAATPN